MTNYTRHRTAAPLLVRMMRSDIATEAGFITLILAAAVAIDGLMGVMLKVAAYLTN